MANADATTNAKDTGMLGGASAATFCTQLSAFISNTGVASTDVGVAGLGLDPNDCKFPMYVVPISAAIEVTGRASDLPCHEDMKAEGKLVQYDPLTMGKCLFFSHTWLRFKHPDSADGVKKQLINELLAGIVGEQVSVNAYWFAVVAHQMKDRGAAEISAAYKDGYVWMDYWSIPQRDSSTQGAAIASIPYYVGSTHEFIVLAGPWVHEGGSVRDLLAWNGRGWCRMEQVSNSLSPKVKPVICATSVSSVKNYGPAEICGRLWFNEVVGKGTFTVDADRYALRDVIKGMITRRAELALGSGDIVWYRALMALTTTILAGTGYEDAEAASLPLDAWLAKMKFSSVLDGQGSTGHTPLRYAVMEGRVDLVQAILEADPAVDVNCPLPKASEELQFNMMVGMTILHQAAMSQHADTIGEIISLLLARGANARAKCSAQNWTALHLAVTSDCRAAITTLMKHDASLHLEEIMAGPRPFQRCAIAGQPETMQWLLEQYGEIIKPELQTLSNAGMSWAMASVFEENSADMLQVLLDNGAQLNIDDGSWMPTPMRKAVPLRLLFLKCIVPMALRQPRPSALIEHFGSALATTPLHAAAITGNLRSLKLLLASGEALDGPRAHLHLIGGTPLHCAAMGGHRTIAETLLTAKPQLATEVDNNGTTAAWWAERRGHAAFAEWLRACEEVVATGQLLMVGAPVPPAEPSVAPAVAASAAGAPQLAAAPPADAADAAPAPGPASAAKPKGIFGMLSKRKS